MVQSICWNSRLNMLSGMQDTSLTVWYYPNVQFVDPRLTRRTVVIKDARCQTLTFLLQLVTGTHWLLVYMVQNRRSLRHNFEISRRFLVTGLHYGMGGKGRDENLFRHLIVLVLSIKRFVRIHCLDLLQGIFVPNFIRIVKHNFCIRPYR